MFQKVSSAAPRYVLHWDNANTCWNVYLKQGTLENYQRSFFVLSEAQEFCNAMNEKAGE